MLEGVREDSGGQREVTVALQDMKFCSGHFVAFRGFRETLHGHNYTAAMRVGGNLHADGYIVDFSDLKKAARESCRRLDGRVLLPSESDVLQMRVSLEGEGPAQVHITCEDGSYFCLPREDCIFLPIMHTSSEELAEYLWDDIVLRSGLHAMLAQRRVEWMEMTVSERPGQSATFRRMIGSSSSGNAATSVATTRSSSSSSPPRPCIGRSAPHAQPKASL